MNSILLLIGNCPLEAVEKVRSVCPDITSLTRNVNTKYEYVLLASVETISWCTLIDVINSPIRGYFILDVNLSGFLNLLFSRPFSRHPSRLDRSSFRLLNRKYVSVEDIETFNTWQATMIREEILFSNTRSKAKPLWSTGALRIWIESRTL